MMPKESFSFSNAAQAIALQKELSHRVIQTDDPSVEPKLLCGMDAAYLGDTAFMAAAVWDVEAERIIKTVSTIKKVSTPYIPGFLAFREGPLLVGIGNRIRPRPDVFFVDGHGIAHPRRFGLASHVGLALDAPTIGVAKSLLYGHVDRDRIIDSKGLIIGGILKTQTATRFFVSVGHRISLQTALGLSRRVMREGFPAPLRRAHLDSILLKRAAAA